MRNRGSRVRIAIGVLLLALVAQACGSSDDDEPVAGDTPAAEDDATDDAAAGEADGLDCGLNTGEPATGEPM